MAEFDKQSPYCEFSLQITQNPNSYLSVSCKRAKFGFTPMGSPQHPVMPKCKVCSLKAKGGPTPHPSRSCLGSQYTLCLQTTGPPTYGLTNTLMRVVSHTKKIEAQSHKSTQTRSAHHTLIGSSAGPHTRSRHRNTEAQRHTNSVKWHSSYQHSRTLKATQADSHIPAYRAPQVLFPLIPAH